MGDHVLTYGDLPESPDYGVAMYCTEGCGDGYSACRGDYFWADKALEVTCGECGAPMALFKKATTLTPVEF